MLVLCGEAYLELFAVRTVRHGAYMKQKALLCPLNTLWSCLPPPYLQLEIKFSLCTSICLFSLSPVLTVFPVNVHQHSTGDLVQSLVICFIATNTHVRKVYSIACAADGQLAGLVQYLQKRLRTLEAENTSLEQVVSRLKVDAEAAARRASHAEQARLETAEQLRSSLRTKEQHERQMQQVQELNLLRESNVTLRLVQGLSQVAKLLLHVR